MYVLLVYNQGNFESVEEITAALEKQGIEVLAPENIIGKIPLDFDKMSKHELNTYVKMNDLLIKNIDCLLVVNNDFNEDYKCHEIDNAARVKMGIAARHQKPIFVLNEYLRFTKKDQYPIKIDRLTDIKDKYQEAVKNYKTIKKQNKKTR